MALLERKDWSHYKILTLTWTLISKILYNGILEKHASSWLLLVTRLKKRKEVSIPNVVSSMGEGSEAGSENLQELEESWDFWLVGLQAVFIQRALAATCILLPNFYRHLTLSQALRCCVLCHSIAVAGVTVHTYPLPLLSARRWALVTIVSGTEVRLFMLEFSVHADDGHSVGGVAVVAPDWSVIPLAHAVADFGQVELVQEVLVEAGVLVDRVVLAVTVIWQLCWPVELGLIAFSVCWTIAVLSLLVVDLDLTVSLNLFKGLIKE